MLHYQIQPLIEIVIKQYYYYRMMFHVMIIMYIFLTFFILSIPRRNINTLLNLPFSRRNKSHENKINFITRAGAAVGSRYFVTSSQDHTLFTWYAHKGVSSLYNISSKAIFVLSLCPFENIINIGHITKSVFSIHSNGILFP